MFYGKPLGFFSELAGAVLCSVMFGNSIAHHGMTGVAALALIGAVALSIAAASNYMQQRA